MTTATDSTASILPAADTTPATPFAGVPAPLATALEQRGFTQLTEVQQAILAADAEDHDLRVSSQTGSGKTVAIGFALAQRLMADPGARRGPAALLITPTRELADQVRKELDWLFAGVRGVTTDCVTGGTSIANERRRLQRLPRVLVGTPGRLLDHVRSGALDCGSVTQLVLDEADQMLDMGFRDDLDAILSSLPDDRRTHMVSATFPPEVMELVDRFQRDPLHVEGTRLGTANVDIEHVACLVRPADRYSALVNLLLLAGDERTLVFVRTRQDTADVAEKLAEDGFSAMAISGELAQAQRTRTLNAFRRGTLTTLVATDVAARGLDVPHVTQVVHLDPPIDGAVYTHRSGRTGRAGRKGRSVVLVPPSSERRVRRLLGDAGVVADWRAAPGAAVVEAAVEARSRAALAAAIDAADAQDQDELTAAQQLLEGRDPIAVVARLIAMARKAPACAPREVQDVAERVVARGRREPSRRTARPASYSRFSINWGAREGATPKRLLAHVCRRGGIPGARVGAIDVAAGSSTFEIDGDLAATFASRVRAPDRREPHLVIRAVS